MQKKKEPLFKEQRSRSIFGTIFVALLIVLTLEILLLTFSIYASRVGSQMSENADDVLALQVDNRSRYLQTLLNDTQELTSLSSTINALTDQLLDEGQIDLDTLGTSSDAAYPLLEAATPALINTLRSKSVNGIFLILNTADLDTLPVDFRLPAVYLRDLDPDAPPSQQNEDLMFVRAPARLVQNQPIATDNNWEPTLRYRGLGGNGFLYPTFEAAYRDHASLDASEYGHWTPHSYVLTNDSHEAIAYSQPLILPDGTVYGVIGVEFLAEYLSEQLPCGELQNDGSGTYFLALTQQEKGSSFMQVTPVFACTRDDLLSDLDDESISFRARNQSYEFTVQNTSYAAAVIPLELYSRNAPFSGEQWALIGAVPTVRLYAFSQKVQQYLFLTVLVTLIAGFVASWFISSRLARPVAKLSAEVASAQTQHSDIPHLSTTGITELDQFATAITRLSKDVLTSSTRFLRIMEMASVELGGYELREDSVYTTDNFFPMLGLAPQDTAQLTPAQFRSLLEELVQTRLYRISPNDDRIFAIPQPDGDVHYVTLRITRIIEDAASEVGLAEDVTATILEQQRIEHERDYDALTGLYSRRAFHRICDELFAQPEKLGCAALLMMDLDNLKHINDTYGHDWGDQYIRQTGQCFARNTPANTLCSRLSGDEFLVLFYGYKTQGQIRAKLDLLSSALRESTAILPNGKELHISISGGVAWYPEDGRDIKTLKKYADFAMYQVKQSHKGRMRDFDIGMYHQEEYAAQTQRDFDRMLQEELVAYHFQPIFNARTGQVVAYEALMRVDLPTLHSPAQVMQLAHETGRLYEIERLTLFRSSETFHRMQTQGLFRQDALLFVNSIANVSLSNADIAEYTRRFPDLLKRLVVEITEQEDLDRDCLERKRNVPGFSGSFALDDYGSGYSNELNLLELSPRYIKIDISIIRGIETNPDKQQIVSNIAAYAHARSMQLIAEGIESESQMRKVIDLGVDLLQGYYLSRPAAVPSPIAPDALNAIHRIYQNRLRLM